MLSLREFISTIIRLLDESNVPYFVTGSFASTAYSEPRATQDIDLVVRASFESLTAFHKAVLARGLYAPSIHPGIDMFNVIDLRSQWKADIILWEDEPFDRQRFERRTLIEILPGLNAYIPTVEDMILAKLSWIRGRESAVQLWDVESMIEINEDSLDREYLTRWAEQLGVLKSLTKLLPIH